MLKVTAETEEYTYLCVRIERNTARPIKHIKQNTTDDSGSSPSYSFQQTYEQKNRRLSGKIGVSLLVMVAVGVATAMNVHGATLRSLLANEKTAVAVDDTFGPVIGVHESSQTIALLQGARNLDPNPSKGGGGVIVDGDQALVAQSAPFNNTSEDQIAPAASDQISLYLVQDGDTLSQVAEMFNVSVNTVVWANELSSDKDIHPGETLLILPVSGVRHTIEEGDTLKSIAEDYGADEESVDDFIAEITEFNGIPSDAALVVGEVLTIPGGEMDEPMPEVYAQAVSSGPNVSGYFAHPMGGWYQRTQGLHGYNGVDFGADYGTAIVAAASGRVIVSRVGGWNGGYGNYVVIEHPNGTQTLYAHNSRNAVWQGQQVVQGQVVGYVGSTGRSTGNHLHFEVRGAANPF